MPGLPGRGRGRVPHPRPRSDCEWLNPPPRPASPARPPRRCAGGPCPRPCSCPAPAPATPGAPPRRSGGPGNPRRARSPGRPPSPLGPGGPGLWRPRAATVEAGASAPTAGLAGTAPAGGATSAPGVRCALLRREDQGDRLQGHRPLAALPLRAGQDRAPAQDRHLRQAPAPSLHRPQAGPLHGPLPYTGEHIRNLERAGGGDPSRGPLPPPVTREAPPVPVGAGAVPVAAGAPGPGGDAAPAPAPAPSP